LALVVRLAVGRRLIPRRQTGLILSLVQLLQLAAGLVLVVDLLAPLLVTAALAVVLAVILMGTQTAQESLGKVLLAGLVLTLQLQRAAAAAAAQVQLVGQGLLHKVAQAALVRRLHTAAHR
jgi:hypothetical protein